MRRYFLHLEIQIFKQASSTINQSNMSSTFLDSSQNDRCLLVHFQNPWKKEVYRILSLGIAAPAMEQLGVIQDPMAHRGSAHRYRADSCAVGSRPVTAVGQHSNWSHSEDPSSTQKSWNFTANRSNGRMIHPWKYMGDIPPKKENKSCSELYDMNHEYKLFLSTSATSKPAKSGPPSKSNIPVPGHTWGHSDCTSFSLGFSSV